MTAQAPHTYPRFTFGELVRMRIECRARSKNSHGTLSDAERLHARLVDEVIDMKNALTKMQTELASLTPGFLQ